MNENNLAPSQNPTPVIPKETPPQVPPAPAPLQNPENTAQKTITNILESSVTGKPVPATVVKLDPNLVQKPMRTFESDLALALAQKQGSSAAISIAENKRKEEEQRIAEVQQRAGATAPLAQVAPPKYGPRPVSPTRETAIQGAVVDIAPLMPKAEQLDSVTATIREAQPQVQKFETKPVVSPELQTPPPVPPAQSATPARPAPPVQPAYAVNVPPLAEAPRASGLKIFLKSFFLVVISIGLVIGGLYAGYAMYVNYKLNQPVATTSPIVLPSLIPKDEQKTLEIGAQQGDQLTTRIYAEINKHAVQPGKILELRLSTKDGEVLHGVTGSSFIEKLGLNMPGIMLRSLTDRWMFGVYGEETGQKTTFIALTTDFFQNSFAGMLGWEENKMADHLALILNFKDRAYKQDPASTSTPSTYFNIRGYYSDKVLRNRDVREFRGADGELLFLYSFINKETLIITTSESAFIAIVDRIEKESYVR